MSRKASDSSVKLKISNPQPFQPSNGFGNRGLPDANSGYRPAPVPTIAVGAASGRSSPGPGPAPARPARSVRRAPDPSQATSVASPSPYRSQGEENQSYNTLQIPAPNNDYDLLVSPISPDGHPREQANSTNAWDQERNQRSQMLQAQQEQAEREHKLQNAVHAFSSLGKGKSSERSQIKPADKRERPGFKDDLMIGHGGRGFDDVDSVLRKIQREWPFVLDPDFAPTSLALSLLPPSKDHVQGANPYGAQDLDSFMEIQSLLSGSLSKAVQNHYQVYAASLPQHANMLTALDRAQNMVKDTKKKLVEGRDLLSGRTDASISGSSTGKRAEMVALWHKERALREMLKTLDTIEHLKTVPDRLETLIADKKFIQAALILTRAIRTINKDELLEIGALSDLRVYLTSQQSALLDILVQELSNHLYLKSHYCDSRWTAYQPGQTHRKSIYYEAVAKGIADYEPTSRIVTIPKDSLKGVDDDEEVGRRGSIDRTNPRLSRFLKNLSHRPNRNPVLNMSDDELMNLPAILPRSGQREVSVYGAAPSANALAEQAIEEERDSTVANNPELDSYAYMSMILEALAILDRLGSALEALSQRIANELFKIVETTIDEASDRADLRKAEAGADTARQTVVENGDILINGELKRLKRGNLSTAAASLFERHQRLRMDSLERNGSEAQSHTLLDLFWTVYSKFRAVLEGQRIVSEVVGRIAMTSSYGPRRQIFSAIPTQDFVRPMQREVRSLLHNYLTDTNRNAASNRKPIATINEVMRNGKIGRDKQKTVFKFGDTDTKSLNKDLDAMEQSLTRAMQTHVPGLVTITDNGVQARLAVTRLDEDGIGQAKTHRLLMPPDPFNVAILFQPYLAFVAAARETVNISSLDEEHGEIGTFMDDFIQKVYLPQLEEKVTNLFQQAANSSNGFSRDVNWARWSPYPIVNSGTQTMALVNSLCYMLATTPFQRENYSRLIIGIIVQYYQKSNAHYKDIVASDSYTDKKLPLAASWSQREDILAVLSELQHSPAADTRAREELSLRESKLEQQLLPRDQKGLDTKDIIGTREKFASLADLYHTTRWFVSKLRELKRVREELTSPGGEELHSDVHELVSPTSPVEKPALDLTIAMSQRFDAILSTYEQFGDMVLYTLRIELRCRLIFYIQSSMSKTNYRAENTDDEPDPHIQDLTNDLSYCESVVKAVIPPQDRDFLFVGLDVLADTALVSSGRFVRAISDSGIKKIDRNIAAVQQALRNMLSAGSRIVLSSCRRYWKLYAIGPQSLILQIQHSGPDFTFDEYNHMLTLQCKIDVRAETRANNRLSLLPGQSNGMTGSTGNGQRTFDSDRTAYNDALIELHSFFM